LIAFIVIVFLIYFATAGWTGEQMAKHVLSPLMTQVANMQAPKTPPPTAPAQQTQPPAKTMQEVNLPGFTLYALRGGLFDSAQNAETLAAQLAGRGAAGTVLQDEEGYHVFIAAYASAEDALAVRDRLAANGVDCTEYRMELAPLKLELTGSAAQAEAMEQTMGYWRTISLELGLAAIAQDAGQKTAVADASHDWATQLRHAAAGLSATDADGLKQRAVDWADRLDGLKDDNDPVQTSRALQLQMAWALVIWAGGL